MRRALRHPWILLVGTIAVVLAIDLGSKALAVSDPSFFGHGLIYNDEIPGAATRIAVCLATLLIVFAISWVAERRAVGPVPFIWVSGGLLLGGTIGNWSSAAIWQHGVPDFISRGDRLWNLADYIIGIGMLTLLVALVSYTVRAFIRGRSHRADA